MLACVSALVSCTGSLSRPLRCASQFLHRLTRRPSIGSHVSAQAHSQDPSGAPPCLRTGSPEGQFIGIPAFAQAHSTTTHWVSRLCTGSAVLYTASQFPSVICTGPICRIAWQEMLNMIRKPVDHHTWAGVCTPAIPAGCPSLPVAQAPYLTDESTTPCFAQAHLRYERPWPKADFQNSHISGSLHRPIV